MIGGDKVAKHPGGRPTKYRKEYCQAIIEWFSGESFEKGLKTITTKKGTVIEEEVILPGKLPLFERFAESIGVSCETLVVWSNKHKEFLTAYTRAKQLQKSFLIENGVAGLYNPQFTIFVAKNVTDMKDKSEVSFPDKDGNPQNIGLLDNLQLAAKLAWVMEQLRIRTEAEDQKQIEGPREENNGD
jgi:hypothetical protein